MNNDCTYIYFRLFTTIIIILTLTTRVSLTSTLLPIYPCHYKDLNQRIYKCDICTCQLSPSLFSTSNLCSSLSTKIPVICSDNNINTTNQFSNEQLLRSRLDEIEFETDHQWSTQYSISTKQIFNNLNFEFDYFNNDIIKNLFNFEQICSSLNNSRLTFYRLQSSLTFQQTCSLTLFSLRFLDSTIDNHQLISSTNPETLIFYNCSFSSLIDFNFTRTTTLSFYYVKFYSKPFLLKSLSTLTYLTLTHTTNFELLGSFSNLIYLDLCHTQLNDLQLNKLLTQVDMPDLTTLILSNNQITLLKTKFPSTIRYLDLSNNHIRSLDYTSFKSLYSLNTLNLSFNSPLDIQQDTFTRIPYLEVLDLTSILPSIPFDDLFLPLQKLRHLNISSNNLQILPRLPVPYDAHTIVSYDHHLPVVYVDASLNKLTRLDFDIFSSSSTQDKYIISLDLTSNQIETFQLPSLSLTTDMKRRGPLIELNLKQNPFVCDCTLYENIFSLLQQNDRPTNHQQQTNLFNLPSYPQNSYPSSDVIPYVQPTNMLNYLRTRRQLLLSSPVHLLAQNLVKQARIKLLHLSDLTCRDMIKPNESHSFFDLTSTNSFCSYTKFCPATCSCCSLSTSQFLTDTCNCYDQCPLECKCMHSADRTVNYVNCSNRYLTRIPTNLPHSTTHLNLNNNQISNLDKNLADLTKLKSLSIANNRLESLTDNEFSKLIQIEELDLSSNQIQSIHLRTFANLFNLKQLQLHHNPWIPKFYQTNGEFQSNVRLNLLTYGNNLVCNRSSSYSFESPLTADDCCKYSTADSCQQLIHHNEHNPAFDSENLLNEKNQNRFYSHEFIRILFHPKYRFYVIVGLSIFILILICLIILCMIICLCRRKKQDKHPSPVERKLLTNGDLKKTVNHYHKSLPTTSATPPQISLSASTTAIQKLLNSTRQQTAYQHQENDVSISYSDNDDDDDVYASIPLTVSQTDLTPVIRPQPAVPPLPPPRQTQQQQQQQRLVSNRPVSHSSTTSTSTTIRSFVSGVKRTNSTNSKQAAPSLAPARSCLQIKLDALVLYSINDSELVHGNIGAMLEDMYGKRFSFYFLHRDRMLGELDWLIENSCVTIIILRKPYHIIHDYMKILSTCSSIKIFLILVNDEPNQPTKSTSLKAREKICKLYRTTNVYEWNPNPSALIHEQLELFLEQNCGSATYVPY